MHEGTRATCYIWSKPSTETTERHYIFSSLLFLLLKLQRFMSKICTAYIELYFFVVILDFSHILICLIIAIISICIAFCFSFFTLPCLRVGRKRIYVFIRFLFTLLAGRRRLRLNAILCFLTLYCLVSTKRSRIFKQTCRCVLVYVTF